MNPIRYFFHHQITHRTGRFPVKLSWRVDGKGGAIATVTCEVCGGYWEHTHPGPITDSFVEQMDAWVAGSNDS